MHTLTGKEDYIVVVEGFMDKAVADNNLDRDVFGVLASGNTPIDGYYLSVPDPWGNLYLQVGTSGASQPNARFCRITSSSNYSAIGNQWQYYGSSGISISNQSIIVNGSYFFINFTGGYLLRIDSSGGVTAFNNSASSGGTPPENQVARGGNSSNQFVISMNPSSSLASWGAWACFNYFDSSGSLLNQYLFNNTGDATNSGRGVTNIQYGPVSNFISFLWSGRFGGTSTSFARNGTAWWSATNSSSAPSLLKATRGYLACVVGSLASQSDTVTASSKQAHTQKVFQSANLS